MHFLCLLLITASPEGLDLEGWYWGRGGRWEGQGSVSPQFDVCIASRPLKKKKKKRLLKMFINFQHLFQKKKKTQNNNQKSCLLHSSIFPCYVLSHMRVVSLVFVVVVIVGAAVVIFVCLIFLFRDAPTAYGSSQTRGLIRATAAGLPTATAMPDASHICNLHHSSWQR